MRTLTAEQQVKFCCQCVWGGCGGGSPSRSDVGWIASSNTCGAAIARGRAGALLALHCTAVQYSCHQVEARRLGMLDMPAWPQPHSNPAEL
jgi:hypothetical protein